LGIQIGKLSSPFTLLKIYILITGEQDCQTNSPQSDNYMTTLQFQDINWATLWQQAKKKKNWRRKTAADWDKKAASFAQRTARSIYTEKFLSLLKPEPDWNVLDIGCGPGTLALPIAKRVKHVTCLDFSGSMLTILRERAAQQCLDNITTHQLAWQDDWASRGIFPHDVAIASRSLAVPDLKAALEQLCTFAVQKVCITDRVGHGPMDPDAFAAIGRELNSGPDFIYTVNLLYQMGYLPAISYIELEEQLRYADFDEALASYTWMFQDLSDRERKQLTDYVHSVAATKKNGTVLLQRRFVPTWAFISWDPGKRYR
jgi:SAM-dependent methyltransferase